jgi:hypothetical protein
MSEQELKQWADALNEIAYQRASRILELEQQLAETREELRIALAQRQDYRAEATQARALLEEVLPDRFPHFDHMFGCFICGASAVAQDEINHSENCPVPRISAFLAQHKEQGDGTA